MPESQKNIFTGKLDLDNEPLSVADNDYIYALNIRNGVNSQGQFSQVSNMKGLVFKPYTQPTGTNKTLGSYLDEGTNTLIYFVYNSNGQHQIRRFFYDTNTVELICEYDFGWTSDQYITAIALVDSELLYWNDPKPRKVNIIKARENKNAKMNVYAIGDDFGAQVYTVVLTDKNGNQTADVFFVPANANKQNFYDALVTFFVSSPNFSPIIQAQICTGGYVDIEVLTSGYYTLQIQSSGSAEVIAVLQNYYELPFIEQYTDAGKYPFECFPEIALRNDSTKKFNYLDQRHFQFRVSIRYDDYERSAISSISDLTLAGCESGNLNYVEIDFTQPQFNATNTLSIVRGVDLFVREGNSGEWKLIETVEPYRFWDDSNSLGTNTYRFYNDGNYSIVDDAYVVKQYDALPRESQCLVFAQNRIDHANILENYDKPCINPTITTEFDEIDDQVYTIIINPRITNTQQFFNGVDTTDPNFYGTGYIGAIYKTDAGNDPLGGLYPVWGGACDRNVMDGNEAWVGQQYLPEGGFIAYLAGTDYFGISQQVRTAGGLRYDSDNVIDATTGALRTQLTTWYDLYNVPTAGYDMYSTLKITGVKRGKYVLRFASHWCSFGDVLAKGSAFYDLNNGRGYQQTSTNVKAFNVFDGTNFLNWQDGTELVLEIDGNGNCIITFNGVTVATLTTTNGEFFVGDVAIEDLSCPSTASGNANLKWNYSANGYIVDTGGTTDLPSIQQAPRTELCKIILNYQSIWGITTPSNPFIVEKITDHNGFFYFKGQLSISNQEITINGILYDLVNGRTLPTDVFYITPQTTTPSILKDVYETGNYTQLPNFINTYAFQQAYIFTTNANFTNNARTRIEGRVVDSNGLSVQSVSVIYTRNGRQTTTDSNGEFVILVYQGQINPRIDDIIFNSVAGCEVEFDNTGNLYDTVAGIIDFGTYTNNNPFAPNSINNLLANYAAYVKSKYLKSGGRYKFALMHVDEMDRRHGLIYTPELDIKIPFLTENVQDYFPTLPSQQAYGAFTFTLDLSGITPPSWAYKLKILRTLNANYNFYIQFPMYDIKYVQYYDPQAVPPEIPTTFSAGNATEIYLNLNQSLLNYSDYNAQSQKSYAYSEGDRIRFIRLGNGTLFSTFIDVPIKDMRGDYIVIDNLVSLPELTEGVLCEVYTPKLKVEEEIFYEIPVCVDIVNGQYAQQTVELNTGDSYRRNRGVSLANIYSVNYIEDSSISDFYTSDYSDIGRPNFIDPDFVEVRRTSTHRFSNLYVPDTRINGLSSFEPLNQKTFSYSWGAIRSTGLVSDDGQREIIMNICEDACFSIYVNEILYSSVAGQAVVALSDQYLGTFRKLKGDYGTQHPQSAIYKDGECFFWDKQRRKVLKYDFNGLNVISDIGLKKYFLDVDGDVIGGYDEFYDQYIVTPLQDNKQTLGWNEGGNGWISFYSFKPECYGRILDDLVSFVGGELWVHDQGNIGEFYGQKYNAQIKFVSKPSPLGIKDYFNIRLVATNVWYCPTDSITTLPKFPYVNGMLSQIPKLNWKSFEGDWWATILRDKNDPSFTNQNEALLRGRHLKGDALLILLENDSDDLEYLRAAEVYTELSMRTNP